MQEKAREIFIGMIRDCGTDIVRMRASFEMYLGQYLIDYPEEKQLLHDAFRVGIPEKILQHAGEKDYDKYLTRLGPRFAEAAKRLDDECAWGVETWAMALGRTADYAAPAAPDRVYLEDLIPEESHTKKVATGTAMAIIVSAGGGLGAGLAALLWPLVGAVAGFSSRYYAGDTENAIKTEYDQTIYFVMIFLTAAAVGAFGALGGWLFGRGAEYPWAGFSIAFGTALTMFFIVQVIPIPFVPSIIWKPIVLFGSVFGSVYKTAARGGQY